MRLVVLAMLLAACATRPASPRPAAQPEPARAQPRPPRFCPPGTKLVGQRPPEGIAVHCERPNGLKHGPYVLWFDNGQKEEEGAYVDGSPRGRRMTWDEAGNLVDQKVFGAPLTVCVYDRSSRRAVLFVPLISMTGPWNARTPMHFDQQGRLTMKTLPTGTYRIEWFERAERGREHRIREFVVDSEHEQTIVLEVDASRRPNMLGGPSPCAPH